jgi:hypothetical protein
MSGDNSLRELFPSSERIAIGGSDPRGTNTIERYQNALIRYSKQSFGIYWEVFRDLAIKDDIVTHYKPSSKKKVDNFKNLKPKMTAFVLQSITPAGEEKIKERYRPEWTKAINEDDFIGLIKLIVTCHTSTGKASEFTDKFIAVEDYRNFTYKEGTTIAEYANQLYLLDRKIIQVGATHLPARDQVYMVIMKLKEHKNLSIRSKVMEYLSRMNKEDFPKSRDEVLETLVELETLSNLTLDGSKTSNKLPSVLSTSKEEPEKGPKIINFTDGSHGFARPDGLYEVSSSMLKESSSRTRPSRGKRQRKEFPSLKKRQLQIHAKLQLTSTSRSSSSRKAYRVMRLNACSNASFVKSTVILKLIVVKRNLQARTIAVIRIKTLLKTRKPRHQSQRFSPSQVLQLQPTLIPRMSPMNLEHMSLMRSSQAFLLHLKEAHMRCTTLFQMTTRFLD